MVPTLAWMLTCLLQLYGVWRSSRNQKIELEKRIKKRNLSQIKSIKEDTMLASYNTLLPPFRCRCYLLICCCFHFHYLHYCRHQRLTKAMELRNVMLFIIQLCRTTGNNCTVIQSSHDEDVMLVTLSLVFLIYSKF